MGRSSSRTLAVLRKSFIPAPGIRVVEEGGSGVRLFVGIPVQAAPGLAAAVRELRDLVPAARVVAPGKWHLTLRFLGEAADPAPVAAALREGLRGAGPVAGVLAGVGAFPEPGRARVAWAGVRAEGLAGLALRVRQATAGLGVPEGHPFTAHLTLARLPSPRDLGAWCARHAGEAWGPFAADAVVLYSSVGGAYEALATVPLAA
jgi:2'-5' RNA ligase